MYIYRDAVILMPTREEHDKFTAFVEANSDIRWCSGTPLRLQCRAQHQEAYLIENGEVSHSGISYFKEDLKHYKAIVTNNLFLVTVDEYIARCIGWDDVESECEIDFGGVL